MWFYVQLSWNSTGQTTPTRTPTPTLGMRLSCNFVNVYMHDSLSCTEYVYTCTDILARKIARVGQVGEILVRVRLVENEVIPVAS